MSISNFIEPGVTTFVATVDEREYHNRTNSRGKPIWYPVMGRWLVEEVFERGNQGVDWTAWACVDLDRPERKRWFLESEILSTLQKG